MILVLGMQLERASVPERPRMVAAAVTLSLIAAPFVALGLTWLLGLSGADQGRRGPGVHADGGNHDDSGSGVRRRARIRQHRGFHDDRAESADAGAVDRLFDGWMRAQWLIA